MCVCMYAHVRMGADPSPGRAQPACAGTQSKRKMLVEQEMVAKRELRALPVEVEKPGDRL